MIYWDLIGFNDDLLLSRTVSHAQGRLDAGTVCSRVRERCFGFMLRLGRCLCIKRLRKALGIHNRSSPNKPKQTCKSGLPRGMRHSHLYTLLGYVNANRAQMNSGCLTDVISLPKQVSIDLK